MIKNLHRRMFFWLILIGLLVSSKELLAQDPGINCFVYHRFGNPQYPSTNIGTDAFEQQLAFLKAHNYNVITFGEAVDLLDPDTTIPQKTVVITIDDGYHTVYENAFPLLREYGYPATLFISTQQVGAHGQLTWQQIGEMRAAGIEIGNHSHSHRYFLDVAPAGRLDSFEADLEKSIREFRDNLGEVLEIYAYPFGEYTQEMAKILKRHGIKGAAAQHSGVISGYSDRYALPRFPMNGIYGSLGEFQNKVNMVPLPVTNVENESPLSIGRSVPALSLTLDTSLVDPNRVTCYWYGLPKCEVKVKPGGRIMVSTGEQLQGRRGKYTLTAPIKNSGRWAWYSHPWFGGEQ